MILLPLDTMGGYLCAQHVDHGVLKACKKRCPKFHEKSAFAQKISHGTLLSWVDVALFENTEGEQIGKPEGVMFVVDVLKAKVLLDGTGIREVDGIASSISPSTSQYQLKVDSTTMPARSCL